MSKSLFIGRSVLDITSLVEKFPESDGKVKALGNDVMPGGSALNAAVVFAHLGGQASLATSLGGASLFRDFLTTDLSDHNVEYFDICDDPSYHVPISTVISTRSTGARMIINDAAEECSILKDCKTLFNETYTLIQLDQYEHHFVEQHRNEIEAFNGTVVLDAGGWKQWSPEYMKLADIPIASEVFCKGGLSEFALMCADLNITRWAMTLGRKGVVWRDGENQGEISAIPVDAVDTLGAGDIFHGAFCYAFANNGKFIEALEYANKIAAESCKTPGTRGWMDA